MKCLLLPVEPIGKSKAYALHPPYESDKDVFPPERVAEGKALRDYRVLELGITLGDAAELLSISVSDYSSLEHGRFTADLEEVRRVLKDGRDQVRASRIRRR